MQAGNRALLNIAEVRPTSHPPEGDSLYLHPFGRANEWEGASEIIRGSLVARSV